MSEDDPVLLPSNSRRLVVEFRSWPVSTFVPRLHHVCSWGKSGLYLRGAHW